MDNTESGDARAAPKLDHLSYIPFWIIESPGLDP